MGFLDRLKGAAESAQAATMNQYIYPSNPFATGEDVTVKVDPEDPTSS